MACGATEEERARQQISNFIMRSMTAAMYNQQQYSNTTLNGGSFVVGAVPAPPPTDQTLNIRAAQLAEGMEQTNMRLATLRGKLFGEGESAPIQPPQANGPLPSVSSCIARAEQELQVAHDQLASILNRL
jgi:hypothetical protein